MANPYSVDPIQLPDLTGMAMQLYGMKQRKGIADQENLIRTRQLDQSALQHADTMAGNAEDRALRSRQVGALEQSARIEEKKLPYHRQEYHLGDHGIFTLFSQELGFKGDNNPLVEKSKELAETTGVDKLTAMETIKNDDSLRQATVETLTKKFTKEAEATPGYVDTKEGQKDYKLLEALSTPEGWQQLIDWKFQKTTQSYKAEQEAAAAKARPAAVGTDETIANIAMKVAKGELTEKQGEVMIHMIKGIQVKPEDLVNTVGPDGKPVLTPKSKAAGMTPYLEQPTQKGLQNQKREVSGPNGQTMIEEYNFNPNDGTETVTKKYAKPVTPKEAEKGPSATEKRMTAKDVADAEAKILSNKNSDVARGEVDVFNQYAEKSYAYRWGKVPGQYFGKNDGWEKVSLPKNTQGKQITAKDIYEFATRTGRTYEDVLEEVLQAAGAKKK